MERSAGVSQKMHVCFGSDTDSIFFPGDFLRFYDLSLGNDLDDSGERYCHSTGPDFSYNSEIQVLFRSNLDPVVSTGFECEVVAQPVKFEEQPALPTITNPPPRVSSFAQEACTDVTVSGGHNHRKNFIIQFRTQNPHVYFKPIMSKF